MDHIKPILQQEKDILISELISFLKIPSISADPKFASSVEEASLFVKNALEKAGVTKTNCFTPPNGYPIVYAEKIIDSSLPTILVYGHYDVQPPDPLDLWESSPFEPIIKQTETHPDGAIFARGACDDKGQMYAHIKAFELMNKTSSLPCNIKFVIEGEEEVGSAGLDWFLKTHNDILKSDIALVSDTAILSNEQPTITSGLKGLSYLEVEITGPNRDLHSGIYGGTLLNPINTLCKMIASLQDDNGRITIPNFYDDIETLTDAERKEIEELPFSLEKYKNHLGIEDVWGEKGYSTNERNSIRPTLDINGIWGGYTGEGAKTVIASKAFAKISMRLVPKQDSNKITELFTTHFESIAPKGVKVKVTPFHGATPYVMQSSHPAYIAASKAYQKTFSKQPFPQRTGGSIPVVPLFEKELGIKTVLLGFGLDSDAIHSPNEHFGVFNYMKAIETIPYFYQYFADSKK